MKACCSSINPSTNGSSLPWSTQRLISAMLSGGREASAVASARVSEAQIAVHWKEEEYVYPSAQFIAQANMTDPGIYQRFSLENFPECFKEYADLLTWYKYWETTLDTSNAPCWRWFVGGKINAWRDYFDMAEWTRQTS